MGRMSIGEKFDVVIVGGGPAGLSAAYFLADKGFEVVVLERGEEIGTKNMFGGRIYSHVFDKYYPGWRSEAPVERWVRREKFTLLCKEDALSIVYNPLVGGGGHDSFTAFLYKFLKWMASRAESVGALVIPGVKVDKIVFTEGYASGVVAGEDRLDADYVIIAEGVNTVLLEGMGIKGKPSPDELAVGVKEVIKLGAEKIDERFGLSDGVGVAEFLLGYPINRYLGGGFLYTMGEYVSLGAVMKIGNVYNISETVSDLAELLRNHRYIRELVGDGTMVEYSAHMVGEGGPGLYLDKPFGNGFIVVGDAAGTLVNTGFTVRGVDYAVESSRLACEAIEYSHSNGDRSENMLKRYKESLDASFIGRSIHRFRSVSNILSYGRLHREYVDFICDVFKGIYSVGEESPRLREAIDEARRDRLSIIRIFIDMISMWRSL